MAKHIITFRNKVYDGQKWLSFLIVDRVYWDLTDGSYKAYVGDRKMDFPKANVLGIMEAKGEGRA